MAYYGKSYLKKCTCGKTEKMLYRQKRCSECILKAERETYLRIHCSVCGRKSEVFHGKQIKPNVCSFCEEELRRIKQAEKDHVSLRVSCKGCGNQINSKTASKNNGFCNSTCSESSKLLNRVF